MKTKGIFFVVQFTGITVVLYFVLYLFRFICMPYAVTPTPVGLCLPCGFVSEAIWKSPLLYKVFFDFTGWRALFVSACLTGVLFLIGRIIKNRKT